MGDLFGTDGIRGEVNRHPLKPELILRIGQALGYFWKEKEYNQQVILGHDGRLSADYIQNLLSGALQSVGQEVTKIGLTSTPALAAAVARRDTAGGVMISASHNPYYDNGIKPFQNTGEKFTDEQEARVEELIETAIQPAYRDKIGVSTPDEDSFRPYIDKLTGKFGGVFDSPVLVDCANGGSSQLAPAVLEKICEDVSFINNDPDGVNINRQAGSLHVEVLKEKKAKTGAGVAFALDGDGDRLMAVDEEGETVNGDRLLYMLGCYLKEKNKLEGGIVITVMSNLGLRRALEEAGIDYEVVGVGDRKVYQKLVERNWILGGEQSGHIIDRSHLSTGDGLHTLVSVLKVLKEGEKSLAEWNQQVSEYPQVLQNFEVDSKPPLGSLEGTVKKIDTVEEELGQEGRVLVRYSGTEPLARVMLEGKNQNRLEKLAGEIGKVMVEEIEKQ